jgi:hypothetical protein
MCIPPTRCFVSSGTPIATNLCWSRVSFRSGCSPGNGGADNGYFIHPYLISCKAEMIDGQLPTSVSLVESECDNATNNLKVFRSQGEKNKNFVVCVKGLSFPYQDMTTRLAEWIEYLNILGGCQYRWYSLYMSSFRCRKDQLLRVQGPPQHQESCWSITKRKDKSK